MVQREERRKVPKLRRDGAIELIDVEGSERSTMNE